MSVFETVADLVQRIHAGYLFDDGPGIEGWAGAVGLPWFAWVDSRVGEGYIILSEDISADLLAVDGWETHPELHRLVLTDWRGDQPVQGRWLIGSETIAVARPESDTIRVRYPVVARLPLTADEWLSHPAVASLQRTARPAHTRGFDAVELAPWVLDDGALEAVVAEEMDPEYARAAHHAGVSDAWQLIEAWRNGIPVEFLSALGGDA